MTKAQDKISGTLKGVTIAGIAIFLIAIIYQSYQVFFSNTTPSPGFSTLGLLVGMFVVMIVLLYKPVFKKW